MDNRKQYLCLQCGHSWLSRPKKNHENKEPRMCPKCYSALWNVLPSEEPQRLGGKLRLFLKQNYDSIHEYFQNYGVEATMSRYHITRPTLERVLNGDYGEFHGIDKATRALDVANMAIASNQELRAEIRELKQSYSQLVPMIAQQLASKIVQALQGIEIDLPSELEQHEQDNLSLADWEIKRLTEAK